MLAYSQPGQFAKNIYSGCGVVGTAVVFVHAAVAVAVVVAVVGAAAAVAAAVGGGDAVVVGAFLGFAAGAKGVGERPRVGLLVSRRVAKIGYMPASFAAKIEYLFVSAIATAPGRRLIGQRGPPPDAGHIFRRVHPIAAAQLALT